MIAVFTLISKVSDAEQQRTKNKNQTVKQDARQVKMQNYAFAKCFNLPCKWNKNRSRQICAPAQFALGTDCWPFRSMRKTVQSVIRYMREWGEQ